MKNRDKIAVMAGMAKEAVSTVQVAKALGLVVNRQNRCACPFHNGKDKNMGMKGSAFHCFVCGEHGDIFHLIQGVTGMTFIDALKWLNSTFLLGMDIDTRTDENRLKQAKKRLKRKADDLRFAERVERMNFDLFLLMCSVLDRLEEERDQNRPKTYGEEWNDTFCNAVNLIPEVRQHMEYYAIQSTVVKT